MRKRRPIPDGFAGRWRRANWVPSPILSAGACRGGCEQTAAKRAEDQREGRVMMRCEMPPAVRVAFSS